MTQCESVNKIIENSHLMNLNDGLVTRIQEINKLLKNTSWENNNPVAFVKAGATEITFDHCTNLLNNKRYQRYRFDSSVKLFLTIQTNIHRFSPNHTFFQAEVVSTLIRVSGEMMNPFFMGPESHMEYKIDVAGLKTSTRDALDMLIETLKGVVDDTA